MYEANIFSTDQPDLAKVVWDNLNIKWGLCHSVKWLGHEHSTAQYHHHHVLWPGESDYLKRCVPWTNLQMLDLARAKHAIFLWSWALRPPLRGWAWTTSTCWWNSQLQQVSWRREMAKLFSRPQSTSTHPLHKLVKIKELGFLTNIFVKSASRRVSRCNSQLLIPYLSYENCWFTFLLDKAL